MQDLVGKILAGSTGLFRRPSKEKLEQRFSCPCSVKLYVMKADKNMQMIKIECEKLRVFNKPELLQQILSLVEPFNSLTVYYAPSELDGGIFQRSNSVEFAPFIKINSGKVVHGGYIGFCQNAQVIPLYDLVANGNSVVLNGVERSNIGPIELVIRNSGKRIIRVVGFQDKEDIAFLSALKEWSHPALRESHWPKYKNMLEEELNAMLRDATKVEVGKVGDELYGSMITRLLGTDRYSINGDIVTVPQILSYVADVSTERTREKEAKVFSQLCEKIVPSGTDISITDMRMRNFVSCVSDDRDGNIQIPEKGRVAFARKNMGEEYFLWRLEQGRHKPNLPSELLWLPISTNDSPQYRQAANQLLAAYGVDFK